MIQNVGGSHESRRSVQFTPYPFLWGICLPQIIQSFPFIPNYFRASPGNQKFRSLAEPLITICLRLQFQRFQSRTETYLFSYPYPCKRGKGKERERAGGMDAVGGAPHGHHRPRTHTFLHWPSNYLDVQ